MTFETLVYRNRWGLVGVVVSVLFLLALISPVTIREQVDAPLSEDARYGFGGDRSVGQSFRPLPNLQSIELRVDISEQSFGPLLLHIREDYFGNDLRTGSIFQIDPNVQKFSFKPLRTDKQKLIWILEAPHDVDQSMFVYREIDDAKYEAGEALMKGKEIPGNFSFVQVGSEPLWKVIIRDERWRATPSQFFSELEKRAITVGIICAFLSISVVLRTKARIFGKNDLILHAFAAIITASVLLHGFTIQSFPVNNDEGAYLQDAAQVLRGYVPIRDFLTKGPVYIYTLAAWQSIAPMTVPALRVFSVLAWVVVTIMMFLFSQRLRLSTLTQFFAVVFVALSPIAIVLSSLLLLQILSSAIVLTALVLAVIGAEKDKSNIVLLSAFLVVIAYLTRASSIVAAPVGLLVIILVSRKKLKHGLAYVGCGFASVAIIGFFTILLMGPQKAAIAFNIEAFTIADQLNVASADDAEPVIRELTLASRMLWKGAPWMVGAILTLPFFIFNHRKFYWRIPIWTVGVLLTGLVLFHAYDMGFFIPQHSLVTVATIVGTVLLLPASVLLAHILRVNAFLTQQEKQTITISVAWLVLMVGLYAKWGNFTDNYIIEFLPPIALLGGVVVGYIGRVFYQKERLSTLVGGALFCGLIGSASVLSWEFSVNYPHSGGMEVDALHMVAHEVANRSAVDTPIFTAQSAVTALANRSIMFNYSHSGWYLYERLDRVPTLLRRLLFAEPEIVTSFLQHDAQIVVTERRTNQVYFDGYPERQAILRDHFVMVAEIKNGSNQPFRVYERMTK